jgi:rhodanese-related sulfurtransferase
MDEQKIEDISAMQSKELIEKNKNNKDFVIIDCRTKGEFDMAHIKDSVLIDFYDPSFTQEINNLDKEKTYLIYCATGSRSKAAIGLMVRAEFKEVYNMMYGITQWYQNGLELVT